MVTPAHPGIFEGISRELMTLRIASEIEDGSYVNLGIGIPTLVSNWIEGRDIVLQSEIGMLNTGPLAEGELIDQDLINASCQPVLELPGCSYFSSADSFSMIRGKHIDIAVLGALQVSEKGDLASWNIPASGRGDIGNIGGSMDLAAGAKKVIVATDHVNKDGEPKIVRECTYPLTAQACVNLIVTNLAVIEVVKEGLLLKEIVAGITPEELQAVTGPTLIISPDLKELDF
ncbi:MAG TPA: 3-oxoacid CoA-transferase subunit B [Dehalococcoidia bacterium]|nr:3-oxoacid CoA-transferase subunit B [Dehalococcoidia bacterium]